MLGISADNEAALRGNGSSQSGLPVQSRQPEALLEVQMHQMRQSDISILAEIYNLWPVRKGSPQTEFVPSTAVFCRRSALASPPYLAL